MVKLLRYPQTYLLFMMAVFFMNTTSLFAQKGNAANFSIYGDLYSGTPIQSIASDDWFKGVTANGMIDESETANFTTITNSKSNQAFTARSPYNQYKELNGFLLYDAIFGRDHVNFGSKWGGRDKSAFLGSSGKNTDNPLNTWDLGTDETVASANDLVDIYAHLRRAGITVGTNMWLNLGVTTISNSGDHYVDFELYKSPIALNGSRTKFINSGPNATGGHSAWSLDAQGNVTTSGDMIAAFEFNGTSVSNVTLRVWTHHDTWKNITPKNFSWGTFIEGENKYGYAEIIIPNGGVYSSGSTSNIPGPPWGTFYDNATDPVTGTYRPGYFVEVGINLSSLGIDPSLDSGNPCDAPFTKLMVKSRSSSSFTSTLKDFAGPYNFLGSSVVDTEIAKSPDIFDSCSSNTITLSPLNPQTGAYYSWTTVDGEFSNGAKTVIGETAIATKPGTYILAAAPLEGCTESTSSIRLYASPCAVDDIAEVVENNGAVVIDILANDFDLDDDIDPTSVKNASLLKPVNGSVSINPSTGQMTYTPNPDFYGVEIFEYRVFDLAPNANPHFGPYDDVGLVTVNVLEDTDGDKIPNRDDIDDDNDGIPDDLECPGFSTFGIENSDFELNNIISTGLDNGPSDVVSTVGVWKGDAGEISNWMSADATNNYLEIWHNSQEASNDSGGTAYSGEQWAEINATTNDGLYQEINTNEGDVLSWSFAHRKRTGYAGSAAEDIMELLIGDPNGTLQSQGTFTSAADASWTYYSGTYTVPAGQDVTRLTFSVISTASGSSSSGNFIDAVRLEINSAACTDTDGDGIPNYKDLDSDNDGLPDVFEAGFLDSNNDGLADTGSYGENGLADDVETSPDSGILLEQPFNTDASSDVLAGMYDFLDVDSDNDGITDTQEAFSDNNNYNDIGNDGVIDGFIDNDNNGWHDPIDAEPVFPRPVNSDSDSLFNYRDLDSDGDGIPDTFEGNFDVEDEDNDGIVGLGDPADDDRDGLANSNDPDFTGNVLSGAGFYSDKDGDGKNNTIDIDSDNDGIIDNTEAQSTFSYIAPANSDSDNDGIDDAYDANTGGFAIGYVNTDGGLTFDFVDPDAENDGVFDISENHFNNGPSGGPSDVPLDTDNDGMVDPGVADTDGDGLADIFDLVNGTSDLLNATNNNQTPLTQPDDENPGNDRDWREAFVNDNDNDQVPDNVDLDDDNDGILDVEELLGSNNDQDGDGLPNSFDLDSDGDGITDHLEASGALNLDFNGNGMPGNSLLTNTDVDANGVPNSVTTAGGYGTYGVQPIDTDGDSYNDYLDLDSDNDGISDVLEAGGVDSDGNGIYGAGNSNDVDSDGLADALDTVFNNDAEDSSGNSIGNLGDLMSGTPLTQFSNGYHFVIDSDGDGIANNLDLDSDDDTIPDNVEAQTTLGYVAFDLTDTDNDGLVDNYDVQQNTSIVPVDTDGDGIPDYLDLDSDDDTIFDIIEAHSPVIAHNSGRTTGAVGTNGLDNNYDDATAGDTYSVPNGSLDNTQADNFPDADEDVFSGGDVDYRDDSFNDFDEDGISDNIDLDDDNDGILDTVESNGNDPLLDADNDGIPNYLDANYCGSLNSFGICPEFDIDADGQPNHLDLDSDGDGCSDALEGGSTTNTTSEYQFPASPVGTDGIPDAVQTTSGANSGNVDYTIKETNAGIYDFLDNSIFNACSADLWVSQSINNASPEIGENVSLSITLTNDGAFSVEEAMLISIIPAELTAVTFSTTNGTFDLSTGIWDLNSVVLAAGDSETLTINATIGKNCGDFNVITEVTNSDRFDPDSTPDNRDITTAEDDYDNLVFTVSDTEDPVVYAPADLELQGCDTNALAITYPLFPYSTDEKEITLENFEFLTGSATDNGLISKITYTDVLGENTLCSKEVTRTFVISDCQNSISVSQLITILDTTPPNLVCQEDQEAIISQDDTFYTISGNEFDPKELSDNCATNPSFQYSLSGVTTGTGTGTLDGIQLNKGETTITWTAQDECSNTSTCSFKVNVVAPAIVTTLTATTVNSTPMPTDYSQIGDVINYEIQFRNNGTYGVTVITVTNTNANNITSVNTGDGYNVGDIDKDNVLDPGENWTFTSDRTIAQIDIENGSVVNMATVHGYIDANDNGLRDTDEIPTTNNSEQVTVDALLIRTLSVTKSQISITNPNNQDGGSIVDQVGDEITYEIVLTNTGNLINRNVVATEIFPHPDNTSGTLSAPVETGGNGTNGDGILDVNETWTYSATYTVEQRDFDDYDNLINRIQIVTDQVAGPTEASVSTPTVADEPRIEFTKTTPQTTMNAPGNINYTISVRNSGNVTLTNIEVTDPLTNGATPLALVTGDTDNDSELDVDETWQYTSYYVLTQAMIDNGSSIVNEAFVTTPLIADPQSATATTTIDQTIEWAFSKIQNPEVQYSSVGEVLTYDLTLTNNGNVTINNVAVTDPGADNTPVRGTDISGDNDAILEPGETWSYTAQHTVIQADIDEGEYVNVATANGDLFAGSMYSINAIETVEARQTLTIANAAITEGGDLDFIISLSGKSSTPISFNPAFINGTAIIGTDTTDPVEYSIDGGPWSMWSSGPLTIPAGATSMIVRVPTVDDAISEPQETFTFQTNITTGNTTNTEDTATGTINDNDDLTLNLAGFTITETDGTQTANFVASIDKVAQENIVLRFDTSNGSAGPGDFTGQVNTVITIPAGSTSVNIPVQILGDDITEPVESFNGTITVTNKNGLTINPVSKLAVATINDDDAISMSISGFTTTETDANQFTNFIVRIDDGKKAQANIIIAFTTADITADNTDYTRQTSKTYTLLAGQSSINIPVQILGDNISEPTESLRGSFVISNSNGQDVSISTAGADGVINDDDTIQVSLSGFTVTETETDLTGNFVARINGGLTAQNDIEISFTTTDVTANSTDYTGQTSVSYIITGGTNSVQIPVTVLGDNINEPTETFTGAITLTETNGQGVSLDISSNTGTILDNDIAEVTSVSSDTKLEGNDLVHTVTMSNPSSTAKAYGYSLMDGTTVPADHGSPVFGAGVTDNGNGTITVDPNVTSFTVTVATFVDSIDETDESYNLNIGGKIGKGTIQDVDEPTITAVSSDTQTEGTNLVHTVTLNMVSLTNDTYSFLLTADSATETDDYTTPPSFSDGVTYNSTLNEITVPAGVNSFTVTVATVDDSLDENDETYTVSVGGVDATGTITDDDTATVSTVSPASEIEGTDLVHTVAMSTASATAETYAFSVTDVTTTIDVDYTGTPVFTNGVTLSGGNITVPASVTSFDITFPGLLDTLDENDETYTVSVGGVDATGTITDDDTATVSTVSPASEIEGTDLVHTVAMSTASATAETYAFSVTDVTTTIDVDYTGTPVFTNGVTLSGGNITVPASVTSFDITFPGLLDTLDENDETYTVSVGGVDATGTITDDDTATVSTVSPASEIEGTDLVHTVAMSTASATAETYAFSVTDVTTTIDVDYTGTPVFTNGVTLSGGNITVPASVTSFDITFPGLLDTLDENDETYTVSVGGVDATGTITDDDTATVSTVSPASEIEGTDLVHTVAMSTASATAETYAFSVTDVTTTIDVDYTGTPVFTNGVTLSGGNITVPASVTSFDITFPGLLDTLDENDETYTVSVGGVDATGTITDDDTATVSTVSPASEIEGTDLVHTVAMSTASATAETYAFSVTDVTTTIDVDYTGTPVFTNGVTLSGGNITVPASVTSFDITFPGLLDTLDENDETYTVSVGGVDATGTITDDDTATVSTVSPASEIEGTDLVHTVAMSTASATAETYAFSVTDVTTTIDVDYTGTPVFTNGVTLSGGNITVPASVTSFDITFPGLLDTLDENDETYTVSVGGVDATGTITDDDTATVSTVSPASEIEGTDLVHTVAMSTASATAETYAFSVTDVTTTIDVDYTGTPVFTNGVTLSGGNITVPASVTSFDITFPGLLDTLDENDETYTVSVGGVDATGTITDDDTATVSTVSPASEIEGTDLVHTVAMSTASATAETYAFSVTDVTTTIDVDYTGTPVFTNGVTLSGGNITVPASVTSFDITFPGLLDTLDENDETYTVSVGGVDATGTITDDDTATVSTVSPASEIEGTDLVHTVAMSTASATAETYAFSVTDVTTTIDVDYTGTPVFTNGVTLSGGNITVPASVTSFDITFPGLLDTLDENDETYTVSVGGVDATGTITDDDTATVSTVSPASEIEGTDLVHTVAMSTASATAETYAFSVTDVTTTIDVDYTGTPVFTNGVTLSGGNITVPASVTSFDITFPGLLDTLDENDETYTVSVGGVDATGTITDDDTATVSTVSPASEIEGTDLVHTVAMSTASATAETYAFSVTDVTTTIDVDYTGTPVFTNGVTLSGGNITVPASVTSFDITFPGLLDTLDENDETYTVSVGGVDATGTITDDDTATVSTVSPASEIEGTDLVHTVAMSTASATAETYAFSVTDVTTTIDVDYTGTPVFTNGVTLSGGNITVPASVTSFDITFPGLLDTLDENDETYTVSVGGVDATGTITDDDTATVSTVSPASEIEGTDLVHTVAMSTASATAETYAFSVTDVTTTIDVDYTGTPVFTNGVTLSGGNITVPASVTSFDITFPGLLDTLDENDETYTVSVGGVDATGTITDDDTATVSTVSPASEIEGTDLVHTVAMSTASATAETYAFSVTDVTTTIDVDYTGTPVFTNGVTLSGGNITVPASVTSFDITFPGLLDTLDENDETYTVSVGGVDATGTITDDDTATVSTVSPASEIEGTDLVHTVAMSTASATAETYAFSVTDVTTTIDVDYTGTPVFTNGVTLSGGNITVPASVTSFDITFPGLLDTLDENDETYTVSVGGVDATGTITDDDTATVSTVSPASEIEGTDLVHTVAMSTASATAETYAFSVTDVTTTIDVDYTGTPVFTNGVTLSGGNITVPASVTSFDITFPGLLDTLDENDETYTVSVGGVDATGTITDDDTATVSTVSPASEIEGTDLVHTVAMSTASATAETYAFSVTDVTTTIDVDYTGTPVFTNGVTLSGGNITVPASVTSFDITFPGLLDTLDENDETYTVSVGGVDATGTITDDDTATVSTVSPASEIEGTDLVHTVAMSTASATAETYAFSVTDVTTTIDVDYTGTPVFTNGVTLSGGNITVPASVTSFDITFPGLLDTLDENDETYTVSVGGVDATGTITDDDTATVSTVSPASEIEGTDLVHTVAMSTASATAETYAFSVTDVTTTIDVDYTGTPVFTNGVTLSGGNITVPASVTSFDITFPGLLDTLDENDETYTVSVGGVDATGTITDDDTATVSTVSPASEIEGTDLVHTVAMSTASATAETYAFVLAADTATETNDYTTPATLSDGVSYDSIAGTITVPARVTSFTVTVATIDDNEDEDPENYDLTIGGVSAIGTIDDNDFTGMILTKSDALDDIDSSGNVSAGDVITYTISVENTGNIPLSQVKINDAEATFPAGNIIASIPPGATESLIATYTLTQANVDAGNYSNQASAIGSSPDKFDDVTDNLSDDPDTAILNDATVSNFAAQPNLSITKTADDDTAVIYGQTITYTYVVTNNGNITMSDVSLSDVHNGAGTLSSITLASTTGTDDSADIDVDTLLPGETATWTATYVVNQADIDAGIAITNTATATATPARGTLTDPSIGESVSVQPPYPAIEAVKTVRVPGSNVGDVIEYDIVVTNTGNVTVTNIEITDANADAGSIAGNPIASLAPGEFATLTANQTITQAHMDAGFVSNSATATGDSPGGTDDVTDVSDNGDDTDSNTTDDATTTTLIQDPAIEAVKTVRVAGSKLGDVIEYDIVVTNTGNVTVTDIAITDANADAGSIAGNPIASLAPGEFATVTANQTITQAHMDAGFVSNSATATGDSPSGTDDVTDVSDNGDDTDGNTSNDATETQLDQNPAMEISKIADRSNFENIGDNINYTINIVNTGNTTINSVIITDDNATGLVYESGDINSDDLLDVGEEWIYTASHTVTNADFNNGFVENTAQADAKTSLGSDLQELSNTVRTGVFNLQDDNSITNEEIEVSIIVFDNDANDPAANVHVTAVSQGANGTVVINTDNSLTYIPNADYNGIDSFEYTTTITNPDGSTNTGTATVTVTVDASPDAVADDVTTSEDEAVVVDVLDNDTYDVATDVEVTSTTTPANGNVVINTDGTLTYTPNPDFNGVDTFEYTSTVTNADGSQTTETTTVTVNVNETPDAIADNATTSEDEAVVIDVLDNDTYDAATDVEVTSTTTPANGNVVINTDGTLTYTPNPDFNGVDTFEYTSTVTNADGSQTTETTTVTVNVDGTPDAVADNATTSEDEAVVIDVLDNDTYDAATDVEVTSTTTPDNGSVVINTDGTLTYTPNPDFNGVDTFEYTSTVTNADGSQTTETTTVTVNVNGTPDAVADDVTTSEDEAVVVDVLDNDTYDPATDVEVTSTTTPDNGSVVINTDGTLTYTPNPDFNGVDTFEYTSTVTNADGSQTTETTTVTVIVDGTPDAVADNATTSEDEAVVIDVLDNDTYDPATDVEVTSTTTPDNGSVVINTDGTLTYTPNPDFNGVDTFEYTSTVTNADGSQTTETTTVTVNVNGTPDAVADEVTTSEDEAVVIDVLDNDTYDPATDVEVTSTTTPANGNVVINTDGTLTYTPNPDFNGVDTFEYTSTVTNADGSQTTETTTVTVNVDGTPDAVADNATTSEDEAVVIDVLDNDTYDPATDVEVTSTTTPANGNVVINTDGTLTYTPNPDFNGVDTFEYTSTVTNADGSQTTETTTVTVNVDGTPDAVADNATTSEDEAVVIDVLDNDTYDPATDVEVTSTTTPANGNVVINTDGSLTYTPNPDFNGEDTFEYTSTVTNADGSETTETTTVIVVVEPVQDAMPDSATTLENNAVTVDVLENDTYGPETQVEITAVSTPENGVVVINPDQTVTYTPNDEFFGTDTFEYTSTVTNDDGTTTTETVIVTITVDKQPDAPVLAVTQPDCFTPNGSIEIESIMGYTYSLNGGEFSELSLFTELTPGIYEVIAMDDKGYLSPAATVEILEQPETPDAPVITDIFEASCEVPTASVILEFTGGVQYYLENTDGEIITDEDNDGIFEDVVPGEYLIYAESDSGCISNATSLILESPVAEEIVTTELNWCVGDSAFDLFEAFSGDYDATGTWRAEDYAESLEGSMVDPSVLGVGTFTFTYTIEGNCNSSTEVTVVIDDLCVVLPCSASDVRDSISKAVTPNGDGFNDYFIIGDNVDCDGFTYDIMIFNRWGAKVFEADNYQNNWDGQSRNSVSSSNQLPAGTYYYFIKMRGSEMEPIQGYIYLGTK